MSDLPDAVRRAVHVSERVADVADAHGELLPVAVSGARVERGLGVRLVELGHDGRRERGEQPALLKDHAVRGVERSQQREENILRAQQSAVKWRKHAPDVNALNSRPSSSGVRTGPSRTGHDSGSPWPRGWRSGRRALPARPS